MGKFNSMDLRERIVGHVRAEHSARAAARVFGISPSTAMRYAAASRVSGDVCGLHKPRECHIFWGLPDMPRIKCEMV